LRAVAVGRTAADNSIEVKLSEIWNETLSFAQLIISDTTHQEFGNIYWNYGCTGMLPLVSVQRLHLQNTKNTLEKLITP
jgi:hypothetical protein